MASGAGASPGRAGSLIRPADGTGRPARESVRRHEWQEESPEGFHHRMGHAAMHKQQTFFSLSIVSDPKKNLSALTLKI